jgi:hypothetical protein
MNRSAITGSANRQFDRPQGVAFTTHTPTVSWGRIARLTVEAVGLLSFLALICGALWSATQ